MSQIKLTWKGSRKDKKMVRMVVVGVNEDK